MHYSPGFQPRSRWSTCVHIRAFIRGSAPSTSSRSFRFVTRTWTLRRRPRSGSRRRIGEELDLPVFLYGEIGGGRRPADFRRGGLEELRRRVESGELVPDAGPRRIDPRSGAVLVGARRLLVAYNLDLETEDRRHRSRGRGGGAGVERRDGWRAGDRAPPTRLRASSGEHERRRPRAGAPSRRGRAREGGGEDARRHRKQGRARGARPRASSAGRTSCRRRATGHRRGACARASARI